MASDGSSSRSRPFPTDARLPRATRSPHVSDDKYTWESSNRVLDGEVRPNIDKIVINPREVQRVIGKRHA